MYDPEDEAEGLALADLDVDGEVGPADIELLLNAVALDDAIADVNQDGQFDGADVAAFETSYLANTP